MKVEILLGTILIEVNRWNSKPPAVRVSDWLERFSGAGFDGLELWEYHVTRANSPHDEIRRIKQGRIPVKVFNSYVRFGPEDKDRRMLIAEYVNELGAEGVKYNLGDRLADLEMYTEALKRWRELLPHRCRLLCECHGRTVMEDPQVARSVLYQLDDSFQAIVHCFGEPEQLKIWFEHLGDRITHAHVSVRDQDGHGLRLRDAAERVAQNLRIMKSFDYRGSFTLEFTEGIRREDETPEKSYLSAIDDHQYLRDKCMEIWHNE